MWCAMMQRNLQQLMEEHASILNCTTGALVVRRYNQLMTHISQLGSNVLRSWNHLTVSILQVSFDFFGSNELPSR